MEDKFFSICNALLKVMNKVDRQGRIYPIDRSNWYKLLSYYKKLFNPKWWNAWKKNNPSWNER